VKILINTDGGCRFNRKDEPAEAAAAFVAVAEDGRYLASQSVLLTGTNNIAEYWGVSLAANALSALRREFPELAEVEIRCDAQLIVRQMNGEWAVKDADMRRLSEKCRVTLDATGLVYRFKWVPRAENKEADLLCNLALDGKVKTDLFTAFPHQNKNGKMTCGQLFRLHGKLGTPRPMRVDDEGYALCNGCGQRLALCTCPVLEGVTVDPIPGVLDTRPVSTEPLILPWEESA
jgi:ribonuclease HI